MISMVTCKPAEGRQWEEEEEEEDENENENEEVEGQQLAQHGHHQRHQSVPRTLVYDVETGSLRFPKSQKTAASITTTTTHKVLQLKAAAAAAPPHSKGVKGEQGNNHFLKLHSESCSGDSSPTCVIRNSTIRSTSSSPTMSTISKESRHSDELVKTSNYRGMSPGSETGKVGDVRASKKAGVNTPGRTWLKGATAVVSSQQAAAEKDLSGAKENGFSVVMHDGARGETEPFKAIQSSTMADRSSSMEAKNKKPSTTRPTSNGFTLHDTSMLRNTEFSEPPCEADASVAKLDHQNRNGVHRSVMGPLLKPAPSKWDDAEKWLTGGNFDVQVKAKSRSGPLLPHVVANQAGMGGQRKGANLGLSDRRHSGPLNIGGEPAARPIQVTELHENVVEVVNPKTRVQGAMGGAGFLEFTNSSAKQQLDLLLDRYSLGELKSRNADGNLMTGLPCDHHGSFLKIPSRTAKPTKESSATRDNGAKLGHYPSEAVSVQDTGTAMTPIESADPSRTATPLRGTTTPVIFLDTPDSDSPTTAGKTKSDNSNADESVSNSSSSKEETPMALADKEFQAKTRQEILALSQRLGKANIAAWATTKGGDLNHGANNCNEKSLDLEDLRRSVIATRAAAWEESEKAKYTSRFQQEEARIQAWESNEKTKAEAEMRKIEDKAERMRSRAHAKLMNKLASARRQAEELRAEAEAHRAHAAAKTTKRAEIMKTTGKFPSLLFFNLLCT